jgi:hypothetical protein
VVGGALFNAYAFEREGGGSGDKIDGEHSLSLKMFFLREGRNNGWGRLPMCNPLV